MARFFIHRPVFACVISLVILLAGALAIFALPTSQYPNITPPTITVTATYTGASAQVVADTVAAPIEQQVNGAENMLYMQSRSTNDGRMYLVVTFAVGTNPDLAKVDVQNRVNQANPLLPPDVVQAGVTVQKQSSQILLFISVFSPDNRFDNLFLSNYVAINMLDPLARIEGVGQATILVGRSDYSMRVWVSPDKLAKLGLTPGDINNAIKEQNAQAASGAVGQPPAPPGVEFQYQVQVKGLLDTVEEFENIIVRTNSDGSILRLKDVARVEMGAQLYNSFGRRNGQPAIPVGIYQQPGANALALATDIHKVLKEMKKSMPEGVDYEVSLDTTDFVRASIEEVIHTLFEAIMLVLIVVFVFLGNVRATIIPMMAVPVSLIGTFAAFIPLGFSINMLTLFGLVLAIGIVVDDAIVVVEAVEHHIEHGMDPIAATEQAMREVSGPVVAVALVLCAVFVPVAFMGGITGQMYQQFAITLAVSVCLSALVALTLTPALCGLLLRPRKPMGGPIGWFLKGFNWGFEHVTHGYTFIVRKSLRLTIVMLPLLLGIYFATYKLGGALPVGFLPPEDNGYFMISATLPDAASLERSDALARKMEEVIVKTPGVQTVITLGGYGITTSSYNSNFVSIFVTLKPWKERPKDQIAFAIIRRLQGELGQFPEAAIQVFNPPPIPGLGTTGGVTVELEDLAGGTQDELADVTAKYMAALKTRPELLLAFTNFSNSVPAVKLHIDRAKVKVLGISLSDVFQALQVNLGGYFVNQFNKFGRTWRVYQQAEAQYRLTPNDIGSLYVRTGQGAMVPVSTLSSWRNTFGPDTVTRYNLHVEAEINGINKPQYSTGQVMKAFEEEAKKILPSGYGIEWTGTAYQQQLAGSAQAAILALGMTFVFLFLAAQYESWGVPFSIILGIPVGIMGALLATLIIHMDNNVYTQIGLVMLVGLAAKNAILIVEFAKMKHDLEGYSVIEAAVAGANLRFRPILMTSFAFILGVVPLVKASGAGAMSRIALGTAVFGGMLAASCLGIFFIPWLYTTIQGLMYTLTGKRRLITESRTIAPPAEEVSAVAPAPAPPADETPKPAKKKAKTAEVAEPAPLPAPEQPAENADAEKETPS